SRIWYVDHRGEATRRNIRVLEVLTFGSRRGEQYVGAPCELRGEERTFRLDRIALSKPLHTNGKHNALSNGRNLFILKVHINSSTRSNFSVGLVIANGR
ncbi:MAG: WYL domain-containing protein, partial [Candidatus Freyrarchaeum guaymaensis]